MDNNILEQKNTETMQAPSPRKKPEFFCSSIIVYAYIEKNARFIFDINQ